MTRIKTLIGALAAGALIGVPPGTHAASHSDAPLIKQDPQANITDVYAFMGTRYDDPNEKVLNVLVQVRPFSEPGDGPHYDRFADDALYSIHITDPVNGEEALRYDFRFSDVNPTRTPGLKNRNTLLSYGLGTEVGPIQDIGDARQNFTQTYSVTVTNPLTGGKEVIGINIPVAPPNVGLRTTPKYNDPTTGRARSGATTFAELDDYTKQAIRDLNGDVTAFAGPREDGFYADIPGIFDLLDQRILDNNGDTSDGLGQDGGGVDGFKGFNVLAYGLQIPTSSLNQVPGFPLVGVYASVSRPRITLRKANGDPVNAGPFVQVNRMGNPVFNEAFVALADKDNYNRKSPTDDLTRFATYALNPELAVLINDTFGTSIVETGRSDLVGIFIPDVLRVLTSTDPVPLPGDSRFRRLSFFDDDITGGIPSGWPNGRRIGDDVIDIALTALASGPSFTTITKVGDNVNANDQLYNRVFPYLGTPNAGTKNSKDSPMMSGPLD